LREKDENILPQIDAGDSDNEQKNPRLSATICGKNQFIIFLQLGLDFEMSIKQFNLSYHHIYKKQTKT
jgi:hypothetical protein